MDERSTEIVRRFKESWVEVEARYRDLINNYSGCDKCRPIKGFISQIITVGDNSFFRAGPSMDALILSRSVDFGLRLDQKHIKIEAITADDFEISLKEGSKVYREYRIKDLNDERLAKLMKTLRDTLVD